MGRFIVEIRNPNDDADRRLLVWSTFGDAPITYGMSSAAFAEYTRIEDGEQGLRELPERMARVREKGTSSHVHASWLDVIECNRAGPNETDLSPAEIWAAYADPPA